MVLLDHLDWMHKHGGDSVLPSNLLLLLYVLHWPVLAVIWPLSDVNPEGMSVFVACRLVPLDKCPGVRPIGIGKFPRRIIAKAILKIVGGDMEDAAGPLQLCTGQDGGCEAAVYTYNA